MSQEVLKNSYLTWYVIYQQQFKFSESVSHTIFTILTFILNRNYDVQISA